MAAAVREAREEAGVEIRIDRLLNVYSYPGVAPVIIVYVATMTGGTLTCDDECLEVRLFAPDEIPWDELAFSSTQEALTESIRVPGLVRLQALMATFVVAHGAWSAGWAWKKMRPRLRERGHELWTPTYTGLGDRAHLASPAVELDTHIQDVCGLLVMEDLRDVILVGHSNGGMVATGIADREAGRIARLVYLHAQ